MKLTFQAGQYICLTQYHERDKPKGAGFRWNPTQRHWFTRDSSCALRLVDYADAATKQRLMGLKRTTLQDVPCMLTWRDGRYIATVRRDAMNLAHRAGFTWNERYQRWYAGDFQWRKADGSYELVPGRINALLRCPAPVRFLSCEPLLGGLDLSNYLNPGQSFFDALGEVCGGILGEALPRVEYPDGPLIHWVICGGESGPKARPMHPDWARSLRDQCSSAGVAFFFKQHGEWLPDSQVEPAHLAKGKWANAVVVNIDGSIRRGGDPIEQACERVYRVGKHRAGRLLDGVLHDAYPEAGPQGGTPAPQDASGDARATGWGGADQGEPV